MKLVVERDVLYGALGTISGVVLQRSSKPILQNVLIDAKGDKRVELLATDLEVGIRATFTGKKVKAARLVGLLREAPKGEVTLECEGERAKLVAGGEFTLLGQQPDEFPEVPDFDEAAVSVPAAELSKVLSRTRFAASKEQTRYAINGISMRWSGKEMEFAATDGRRLAVSRLKVGGRKNIPEATAIIPVKMVSELIKLCGGRDAAGSDEEQEPAGADVGLQLAGNELLARSGSVALAGRLVEGSFPRYAEVVPAGGNKTLTIAVDALVRALSQAIVMTTEEARSVRFVLGAGKQSLEVQTPEVGDAQIPLDGAYKGADIEIAFNPAFVTEGLKALDSDEAELVLEAPDKAVLIEEGKDFTYVVMPVKV